ncbi:MAG: hypothetical protein A2341_13340 [Deltaproteobacteria bacterium RIFOXYB12_FULL_58_9]|nr:MAG: hypothetical protein A2341_13340 [Deltaproteobacteria bacterium RIFOXYB12_FULL_58_9]
MLPRLCDHNRRSVRDRLGLYFEDQMRWLEALGVAHSVAKIESEAGAKQNAKTLSTHIELLKLPVLIFFHSKGGIDTLEMLVSRPDLRDRVAGWIAVQSPFMGSPIADLYLQSSFYRGLFGTLLGLMGGSLDSLTALSSPVRLDYYQSHATEIARVTEQMPFVAFMSWQDDNWPWEGDTPLEPYRDFMLEKMDLKNDGLVPVVSAGIPGCDLVVIANVDHRSTVLSHPFVGFNRARFAESLFTMLRRRQF